MSDKVIVPVDIQSKLAGANGNAVPLCDEAGNIIAYALSPARMAKIVEEQKARDDWASSLWSGEEIARIKERLKDDTRLKRTMAEVLHLVENS